MRELIERYYKGDLSRDELEKGVREYWQNLDEPDEPYRDFEGEEMWSYIMEHGKRRETKRTYWPGWAAAAAVLFFVAGGFYYWNHDKKETATQQSALAKDIAPGHAGAILTLSNGKKIVLDSANNGALAMDGSIKVIKENGEIKYTGENSTVLYNDINTDRGRTWSVTLPDGSKAWLNASSSIHYPLSFTGKERLVEITGEAYFEVVHNDKMPFKVKAGNKIIEDIGTAFNINSYDDEPVFVTTVLEGKARLQINDRYEIVSAGDEVSVDKTSDHINLQKANGQNAIAWKNGYFSFGEKAALDVVMRQMARWYDIEISYPEGIPHMAFFGDIERNLPLSSLLKILEKSNVKFRVEGKRLVVLP